MVPDPAPDTSTSLTRVAWLPDGARHILEPLWRRRVTIVVVSAVFGILAGTWSSRRAPLYEASATIMVNGPRLAAAPDAIKPEQLIPVVVTDTVANEVIDTLHLTGWTPDAVLAAISVRPVSLTPYLEVVARTTVADQAVPLARAYAQRAVEAVRVAAKVNVDADEAELKHGLDAAADNLKRVQDAYTSMRVASRVEVLEREAEAALTQRARLADLSVELDRERARLAQLEIEFHAQPDVLVLRQGGLDDAALAEVARTTDPATARALRELSMTRETQNQVYVQLGQEVATARAKIAGLTQEARRITALHGALGSQPAALTELNEARASLERLDAEHRLAQRLYEGAATRYQETMSARLAGVPSLVLVNVVPAPRYLKSTGRDALFGSTAGLLFVCVGVLIAEALRPRRSTL